MKPKARRLLRAIRASLLVRLLVFILALWVAGAVILRCTDGATSPDFDTLPEAFWNIAVYLFSGLDSGVPQTTAGRIVATLVLVLSAGVVAVFTGEIASFLIERRLGRKVTMPHDMQGHMVICNWNDKVVPTIYQLHAEVVLKDGPLPVVVICDTNDATALSEQREDDPRLDDVYLVKGDPTKKAILKRAKAHLARSVIVLADPKDGDLADAKSILIVTALKSICDVTQPHICVEGIRPENVEHFHDLGVSDVVAASDLGMRLLSQAALDPGLTDVYTDLLTNAEDSNELYAVKVPGDFTGTFTDLGKKVLAARNAENPVILIGVQRPDGRTLINPKSNPTVSGANGDKALVIAFDRPAALL